MTWFLKLLLLMLLYLVDTMTCSYSRIRTFLFCNSQLSTKSYSRFAFLRHVSKLQFHLEGKFPRQWNGEKIMTDTKVFMFGTSKTNKQNHKFYVLLTRYQSLCFLLAIAQCHVTFPALFSVARLMGMQFHFRFSCLTRFSFGAKF